MKTYTMIILLTLTMLWNMDLTAKGQSQPTKKSVSLETVILKYKHDRLKGYGLAFQYRVFPQIGVGMDIVVGGDKDGEEGYMFLFPNVSFHFLPPVEKWDLFVGLAASLFLAKQDFTNTDHSVNGFGFAGVKVNFSRNIGSTLRGFLGGRGMAGGSLGLTYSF